MMEPIAFLKFLAKQHMKSNFIPHILALKNLFFIAIIPLMFARFLVYPVICVTKKMNKEHYERNVSFFDAGENIFQILAFISLFQYIQLFQFYPIHPIER